MSLKALFVSSLVLASSLSPAFACDQDEAGCTGSKDAAALVGPVTDDHAARDLASSKKNLKASDDDEVVKDADRIPEERARAGAHRSL